MIRLLGAKFLQEVENEALASVGVSLVRNNKVVTAKTIRSLRAQSVVYDDALEVEVYGDMAIQYIQEGKPAGTKLPVDYKGTRTGRGGKPVKVFELKQHLKDWKAAVGFGGTDFQLARAIADNARAGVDLRPVAFQYFMEKTGKKIIKEWGRLVTLQIQQSFDDGTTG